MGHVRPTSATSEAIEAEVLLKVWVVLHPRAVGEGVGERSERRGGVGERSERRGGPASEASLPLEASQVAAEGSGLRFSNIRRGSKLEGCAFVNFGNSREANASIDVAQLLRNLACFTLNNG